MARKKGKKGSQKRKPTTRKKEVVEKEIVEGFRGGVNIPLRRKTKDGVLETRLSNDVARWLKEEIDSQSTRIRKLAVWENQYRGIKPDKSFPYPGASNVAVPLTKPYTDAIMVRLHDVIFSQRKLWIIEAKKEEFMDIAPQIEDSLDWWQKNIVKLKQKLRSPLLQCVKTGTGIIKFGFNEKPEATYRYATPEEENDPNIKKYPSAEGVKLVKDVITSYVGPTIYPVPREDFVISSDASEIDEAFLVGMRSYYRKPELDAKVRQGLYRKDAVEKMVSPDEIDETKKTRAEAQGKTIDSYQKQKFEVWEVWLRYDVDGDGVLDDIVVTIHLPTKQILRAIYNPYFYGFRPFISFRFYPTDYQFDGMGVCEILEQVQEEIDAIHNQRADRRTLINCPMFLERDGAGLEDFEFSPGKIHKTADPTSDVVPLLFPDTYPNSLNEEMFLVQLAQKSVGITPEVLGQPTAERPVAREASMRLEEANKIFKYGQDNVLTEIGECGYMALDVFVQYQPTYNYYVHEEGQWKPEKVVFPPGYIRDGVNIKLTASNYMDNQEIRRMVNQELYALIKDYNTGFVGALQMIFQPQIPQGLKMAVTRLLIMGEKLVEDIVRDYGKIDAENLITGIADVPGIEQAIAMSPPVFPPPEEEEPGEGGENGPPMQPPM